MPRVLFVATVVKQHIMKFHVPYLRMFKDAGWETAVAACNDYENKEDCLIPHCDEYYDISFARSPFHTCNISAYKELKNLIKSGQFDIIHCHTPVGGVLGRLAARKVNKTRVIYTAHGFHFFKGAPIVNWMIYYPVEKWMARYTDTLITINKEDYQRAKKFNAKEVCFVPGVGINLEKFSPVEESELSNPLLRNKRKELSFREDDYLVLSIGDLNRNKNHEVVIRALAELKKNDLNVYNHLQYLVCGNGDMEDELIQIAMELNVIDHIHFLGYRNDIREICQISDLFVFMSLREGLPVALMEALASGLPVICSNIRGNQDIVVEGENGIFCENICSSLAEKISAFQKGIIALKDDKKERRRKLKPYDILEVQEEMRKIYFGEKAEGHHYERTENT